MKNITLVLVLISTFCFGQMPDISIVWLNNHKAYKGTMGKENEELKLSLDLASQDIKNDQEYFVSGYRMIHKDISTFEGKFKITSYKNTKKGAKVFGEYELFEKPKGKESGIYKGKFIYTFRYNKKTQKIESPFMEFVGDFENYDKDVYFKTEWKNQ